jgi:hypothetical protein
MAVGTGRFKRGIKTYFIGEGEDSLSRLLSVFRGLPCGSDGLRGGRNWTDAVDDFLDKTPGRSLSWYEGRRESMESSRPAKEADVVVLGAAEVLLEGTTSSLRRVSCPPVGLSFCS